MNTIRFDAAMSRRVESTYTTPDVVEQRRIAVGALSLQPGERVLDIGSGPGFLACEDVVTSTQVYEYVADMPRALAEAHRVLRRGGRLLVLDTDWDSIVWASSDANRMRRILTAWDEHLADPHLPRRLAGLMADAGFEVTGCQAVPLLNTSYSESSFSAGLIGFITAFVPGNAGVTPDESTAWADDLTGLGRDYFFSLNRYLFLASKSPSPHEAALPVSAGDGNRSDGGA